MARHGPLAVARRLVRRRALFDSVDPDNPRAAGFARVGRRSRIVPDLARPSCREADMMRNAAPGAEKAGGDDEECRIGGPEMMSEAEDL